MSIACTLAINCRHRQDLHPSWHKHLTALLTELFILIYEFQKGYSLSSFGVIKQNESCPSFVTRFKGLVWVTGWHLTENAVKIARFLLFAGFVFVICHQEKNGESIEKTTTTNKLLLLFVCFCVAFFLFFFSLVFLCVLLLFLLSFFSSPFSFSFLRLQRPGEKT